jgi:predicted molibdopterin-dependent oxidoreductase YjgC
MVDVAYRGGLDVFWMTGGNFLETLPDPAAVAAALSRVDARIHQDVVTTSMMLLPPKRHVLLLPATTRYESPGGGTQTTTERRIVLSPEIPGRRVGRARPEWEVFGEVAARVRPERAGAVRFPSAAAIREEISRAFPLYAGIEELRPGESLQWGGERLYADGRFATPDGKARFSCVEPPDRERAAGELWVSTRRGRQFNSMVHRRRDALTGAERDEVLISAVDAERIGARTGDRVRVTSSAGVFEGRARVAPIKEGNLEVHWPEGNVLLSREAVDRASREPDYNARARIERLGREGSP